MPEFRSPPGTHDVLPPESARWQELVARFAAIVGRAGYGLVVSPAFEDVGVFQRVGEGTDVVRKEMYDFEDKGGRHLALRPEGTAPVVRAWVQHRPPVPFKAWYAAPNFRYEHAQAGRYRQHHQLGVEVLGTEDPDLDVEVVALAWSVITDLGLRRVELVLNSLGDSVCRPGYLDALRQFLDERRDQLCDEHRDRVAENPLRVLDCKREACRAATADAPHMVDHLCEPCRAHFARVRVGLDTLGVPWRLEPRLVRGLDYYTRTAFELVAGALETAQNGVGGGGRYDRLAEDLGGPPTPGIGFGIGIERLLLTCDAEGVFPAPSGTVEVFVIDTTGGLEALQFSAELRAAGVRSDRAFDRRSMKAQFRAADRSGAALVAIIGERERVNGTVTLQDLDYGRQEIVSREKAVERAKERLKERVLA
ncbi:MAG TPA: histidine--tRNA ligase [Acidimicrobiales bacterium]|nr:histidine--tRNA ligase [Acidimicrobiales bacterium]